MYRIELAPGEVTVFRTIEELATGVRNGVITTKARIYHGASEKWLPIEFHPHYKQALELLSGRAAEPHAPKPAGRSRSEGLKFLNVPISPLTVDPFATPTPAPAQSPQPAPLVKPPVVQAAPFESRPAVEVEHGADGPSVGELPIDQPGVHEPRVDEPRVQERVRTPEPRAHEARLHEHRFDEAPIHRSPVYESPIHEGSTHESSTHETSTHETSTHETSTHETSTQVSSTHESSTHGFLTHGFPARDSRSHEFPNREPRSHDSPAHYGPAYESPARLSAVRVPRVKAPVLDEPLSEPPRARPTLEELFAPPATHRAPALPPVSASPVLDLPKISYPEFTPAEAPVAERSSTASRAKRPLHLAGAVLLLAAGGYASTMVFPFGRTDGGFTAAATMVDRPIVPVRTGAPSAAVAPAARTAIAPPARSVPVPAVARQASKPAAAVVPPSAPASRAADNATLPPASSGFAPALEPRAIVAAPKPAVVAPGADSTAAAPPAIEMDLAVPSLQSAESLAGPPRQRGDSGMKKILRTLNGGKALP